MNFIDQLAEQLSILRGHVDNTEVAYINAPVDDLSGFAKTVMSGNGLIGDIQEAGRFHVTLAIFPNFPDEAISKFLELSLPIRFNITAVKLGTFPEAPSKPLIVHVDAEPALIRLQSDIYNLGLKLGLQLPDFDHFKASLWQPHVTLAMDVKNMPEQFAPINPVKLSVDRFVVQREGYDQVIEINLPGSIKDRPFITVRSIAQMRHGQHIGQEGRKGESGGSQPGFTHGTGSRPSWAGNKTTTEGGHLLRSGKFALTKDRWAIDEDGEMIGAWHDTPEEAVKQFDIDQEEGAKSRERSAKEAAALKKIISGDLSEDTIKAWSGRRLNMRQTYAIGWIRELGIRWTDAKKIVESSPSAGVDSGGGRLINIQEALALALDFLNQAEVTRIAPRTLEVTEDEFVAMLRGEVVVHGPSRRVLTFEDGPFTIRHGKHIGQEGRKGEKGGTEPGFKHEDGEVDGLQEEREAREFTEDEQEEAQLWAQDVFAHADSFDEDSQESLELYKNNFSTYKSLNEAFRSEGKRFIFENNKFLFNLRDTIDRAMERSTVPEDVVVYRGVSGDLVEKLIAEGGEFDDPAYVSTSLTMFDAKDFAEIKDRPTILKINVPKGTPALYMESFSILSTNEEEILLDRGLKFEFVPGSARAEGKFSVWDVRVIGKSDAPKFVERRGKHVDQKGRMEILEKQGKFKKEDIVEASRGEKFIWTSENLEVGEKEIPLVADTPQGRQAAGKKVPIGLDEPEVEEEEVVERGRPVPPKPKTIYVDKKKEYPDYFKGQERLGAAAFGTQVFTPFLEDHINSFEGSRQSAAREAFHRVVGAQKENNSDVHGFALSNNGQLVGIGSLNFKPENSPDDGDFIDIESLVTTEPGNTQAAMEKLINQAASEKRGISMNASDGAKDFLSSIGMRKDDKGTFFLTPEDIEELASELKGPKTGQYIAPSSKPKIRQRFGRLFEEDEVTMPIDNLPPPISRENQDFQSRDKWDRFNWDAFQDPEMVWDPDAQMAGVFEENQNALFQDEIDEDAERGKSEILGKIKEGGSSSVAFGRMGQSVAELFGGKPRDMKNFIKNDKDYERDYGLDVVWPDGKIEDEEGASQRLSDFAHQAEGVRDEDSLGSWPDSTEYIYNRTQAALKEAGFETSDKVRLFRGLTKTGSLPEDHDGGYVKLNLGAISSWTFNRSTAAHTATQGGRGTLLRVDVPVSRIFSMWATGPGSREAMEYLILGQDGIRAWATKISRK